jgi:hypothetical protein
MTLGWYNVAQCSTPADLPVGKEKVNQNENWKKPVRGLDILKIPQMPCTADRFQNLKLTVQAVKEIFIKGRVCWDSSSFRLDNNNQVLSAP